MTSRLSRRSIRLALAALVALVALGAGTGAPAAAAEWQADLRAWKADRDAKLRRPDGWLTLVGLSWLEPGDNLVGSARDATVRLPPGHAPERLGTLVVNGERVRWVAGPGAETLVDDHSVTEIEMASDRAESGPTVVRHGSVSFYVIERSGRLAVRVKDSEAEALRAFSGLDYFPVDAKWRVPARFEPAPAGSTLEVPNALGFTERIDQPGWVEFELGGATHRLVALDDTGDGRLFLVFGDRTNGSETYGGGRFLYTDPPVDGRTTIDFNRAYNPPCVFTPYATCPLPPRGNKLDLRVEAGEKKYAHAVH